MAKIFFSMVSRTLNKSVVTSIKDAFKNPSPGYSLIRYCGSITPIIFLKTPPSQDGTFSRQMFFFHIITATCRFEVDWSRLSYPYYVLDITMGLLNFAPFCSDGIHRVIHPTTSPSYNNYQLEALTKYLTILISPRRR